MLFFFMLKLLFLDNLVWDLMVNFFLFKVGIEVRFFVIDIIIDSILGLGKIVIGDCRSFLIFSVLVVIIFFLFLYRV